jgi:hypothetical protein
MNKIRQDFKEITLTQHELHFAASVGVTRHIEAILGNKPDAHGLKTDKGEGWYLHIEGATTELAVAKCLNRFWNGSFNTYKKGGDIGAKIQVRRRTKLWYDLLVREDDDNDSIFVLAIGIAPTYRIVGWLVGKEAKQNRWIREYAKRPSAYFVPQQFLRPIQQLHKFLDLADHEGVKV